MSDWRSFLNNKQENMVKWRTGTVDSYGADDGDCDQGPY